MDLGLKTIHRSPTSTQTEHGQMELVQKWTSVFTTDNATNMIKFNKVNGLPRFQCLEHRLHLPVVYNQSEYAGVLHRKSEEKKFKMNTDVSPHMTGGTRGRDES